MLELSLFIVIFPLILFLSFSACYNLIFAFFALTGKRISSKEQQTGREKKILVLIPAHNEEFLIGRLLDSMEKLVYPPKKYNVLVIADNCTDKTVDIVSRKNAQILIRKDENKIGKGHALTWAFSKNVHVGYDAVLIIDADNIVDPGLLRAVNTHLSRREIAIQCNNGVANPDETWFTRIMHIARVINNELFYQGRYVLGLSNIFTGNGMCLTSKLLTQISWQSEGISEDKEQSIRLIKKGVCITFAVKARIFAQESKFLGQAFTQRLRWSGGKFKHTRKYGLQLFIQGIKKGNFKLSEAILPLILPNHSLLANMTIFILFILIISPVNSPKVLFVWSLIVLLLQIIYLMLGFYLAKADYKTVISFALAPAFLFWKAVIDLLSFFGYRNDIWERTKRLK